MSKLPLIVEYNFFLIERGVLFLGIYPCGIFWTQIYYFYPICLVHMCLKCI